MSKRTYLSLRYINLY